MESSLRKYQQLKKPILDKKIESLTEYYIENVLKYEDKQVPRLFYLERANEMISQAVPDQKYLNPLYLE